MKPIDEKTIHFQQVLTGYAAIGIVLAVSLITYGAYAAVIYFN